MTAGGCRYLVAAVYYATRYAVVTEVSAPKGWTGTDMKRGDTGEHLFVHCSFLVRREFPSNLLGTVADPILWELAEEDGGSGCRSERTRKSSTG
ncbi:hypothetical protein PHMEG_0004073 [Phytophthora megakarya]|uniref:Uncharacterized protein n=1 Tax=Phytophthora megakarya TaxID=4795 RepID=A0A225WUR4_9STRA|nr:hypothetical protein PHMEG_0004073 [Phytophthora megakarya]